MLPLRREIHLFSNPIHPSLGSNGTGRTRSISFAHFKNRLDVGSEGRSAIRAGVICGFELGECECVGKVYEEEVDGGVEGDADALIVDEGESGRCGNVEADNGDAPRWVIDGTG